MSLIVSLVALLSVSPQGVSAPGLLSPASAASTLSWKDFDRDGREDVYVVRPGFADRLLRNVGDGSFEERSLATPAPASHSAAWGDFDGDGWADLFLSARLGGVRLFTNLGDGRWPLGTVEEYDPTSNTWTTKAPMPTPRVLLTAVAVAGKIYAIGGLDNSGYVSVVEEYDPAGNSWTTKAPMASARGYHCASASPT